MTFGGTFGDGLWDTESREGPMKALFSEFV